MQAVGRCCRRPDPDWERPLFYLTPLWSLWRVLQIQSQLNTQYARKGKEINRTNNSNLKVLRAEEAQIRGFTGIYWCDSSLEAEHQLL